MNAIEQAIREIKGAQNVGLTCRTRPKLKRKRVVRMPDGQEEVVPNPFAVDAIEKVAQVQGMVGIDYEHSARREEIRRGGDGTFESGETWGHHETPAIVEHNGRKYVQVKIQHVDSVYLFNGEVIPTEQVFPYLPERKDSLVKLCRYALENIEELRHNHQTYRKD